MRTAFATPECNARFKTLSLGVWTSDLRLLDAAANLQLRTSVGQGDPGVCAGRVLNSALNFSTLQRIFTVVFASLLHSAMSK